MDAFQFPPDPGRREQLEQELARAALALLEFSGSAASASPRRRPARPQRGSWRDPPTPSAVSRWTAPSPGSRWTHG